MCISKSTSYTIVAGLSLLLAAIAAGEDLELSPAQDAELAQVREAIVARRARWQPAPNPIALLIREERAARCGALLLPRPYAAVPPRLARDLPGQLDWRANDGNWITPVRDQGGCGSCWLFGALADFESFWMIQSGIPDQDDLDFSEQYILSCGFPGGCAGGWGHEALQFLIDQGTPDETCFPYVADDTVPCFLACADVLERLVFLDAYEPVTYSNASPDVINAALQHGPVHTNFDVYDDFYWYDEGVYSHVWGEAVGGHVVLIVGYDDDQQAWLAKNSWGPDFGQGGYFWIAYDSGCGFGTDCWHSCTTEMLPTLLDPELTPAEGVAGETFTWSVTYRDIVGPAPYGAFVQLHHPGGTVENLPLASAGGDLAMGVLYTATAALADTGAYHYCFTFANDLGQAVRLPAPSQGLLGGPVVHPYVNQTPTLTQPDVDPDAGALGAPFTFSVVFRDEEGDLPVNGAMVAVQEPGGVSHPWPLATDDLDSTDGSLYAMSLPLSVAGTWRYRFVAIDAQFHIVQLPADPAAWFDGPIVGGDTAVADAGARFALLPPSPNPANPGTQLTFSLATPGHVTLAVHDLHGRRVRTLWDGSRSAGIHQVAWDGRADRGDPLPSGVYVARLSAAGETTVPSVRISLVR